MPPLVEVVDADLEGVFDGFGEGGGDAGLGGDLLLGGGGEAAEGAEGGEELAFAGRADAGELVEDGFFEGAEAEGAVEGDGEAVGLVAETDENLEGGGVAGEDEVGAAVIEDDFLEVFVEAGDGDGVEEAEFAEDGASGADLEFGAVAEDEVREGEAFVEDAGVAAADDLGHGVGVVVGDGADTEAAVAAFVGHAVDGDDHGGDGVGAHEVRDVEALDDARGPVETEEFGELGEALFRGGLFEGGDEAGAGAFAGELFECEPGVAEAGGLLEVLFGGGLEHLLADLFDDGGTFTAEEGAGLVETGAVVGLGDAAEAGRGAETDDVGHAVGVVVGAGVEAAALAQAVAFLGEVEGGADDGGRGEGAEVARAVVADDAAGDNAREGARGVGLEGEVAFVVAQEDVEAGAVGLDEVALGEEGLGLGADDADLEVFNVVDQTAEFGRSVAHGGGAEVTLHAPSEVDGLADVDNGAGTVAIEIATGLFWQVFEFLAQDVVHAAIVA